MQKANVYFYIALICAIWFIFTSFVWTYFANIVISFPFGVISYFMMRRGKQMEGRTKRFKIIENILIIGCVISVVVLIGFLITN